LPGIRQKLKEIALLIARKTGLLTLGKKLRKKNNFSDISPGKNCFR